MYYNGCGWRRVIRIMSPQADSSIIDSTEDVEKVKNAKTDANICRLPSYIVLREASELKDVTKSGKSPQCS